MTLPEIFDQVVSLFALHLHLASPSTTFVSSSFCMPLASAIHTNYICPPTDQLRRVRQDDDVQVNSLWEAPPGSRNCPAFSTCIDLLSFRLVRARDVSYSFFPRRTSGSIVIIFQHLAGSGGRGANLLGLLFLPQFFSIVSWVSLLGLSRQGSRISIPSVFCLHLGVFFLVLTLFLGTNHFCSLHLYFPPQVHFFPTLAGICVLLICDFSTSHREPAGFSTAHLSFGLVVCFLVWLWFFLFLCSSSKHHGAFLLVSMQFLMNPHHLQGYRKCC